VAAKSKRKDGSTGVAKKSLQHQHLQNKPGAASWTAAVLEQKTKSGDSP